MKHHIPYQRITKLFLSIALMAVSTNMTAQDSLWTKPILKDPANRFYTNTVYDISGADSIEVHKLRLRIWKDGKTTSINHGNVDQYSFRNPGQTLYCPAEFKEMDWYDTKSKWCFQRSMESEHFIVFWEAGFGLDPTKASNLSFNPRTLLNAAEKIYQVNTQELGFSAPGSSYTLDHYKHILMVLYQSEWLATGSGYDDKVGAFWCNPAAVNDLSTLAHELGHTFQYIIRCDLGGNHGWRYGFGDNGEGGCMFWETCAQWQSAKVYPSGFFSGYGSALSSYVHMNPFHEDVRYINFHYQDYWCQLHGNDFIGRLWKGAVKPEDAVDAYKRITGINQETFNDEMFNWARRAITWDIDALRTLGRNQRDHFTTAMHDNADGWLEPDAAQCPQNYGFNVLRMTIPSSGTTVTAHFKGEAGKEGYRAIQVDKAGWRYGFVALCNDDQRIYSDIGRNPEGDITFTIPSNTQKLWFVVSGAPTSHFHHLWDDNTANDEQWPYAVTFSGTDMQGHVRIDPMAQPHDTTIVCNVYANLDRDNLYSGNIDIDLNAVCNALTVTADNMKITRSSTTDIKVLGINADGSLSDQYASNYSFAFYYDNDGNVTTDTEAAAFYIIYTQYSGRYYLYFGELQENFEANKTYPFGIAFQRTDKEGKAYTAKIVLNYNIIKEE